MERYIQLGLFHLLVGAVMVLMAVWALYPASTMGYEPVWHAALKIIFGALMMGAGFKLLRV
ncbi:MULTISPECIES: hypothetical protein [Methanothermobacter]|uniref:hypothetical protein n=1 Tax=Methanothermobacter TaxID=145260 RepID=UPI000662123C|nr:MULTISPECIES: hypothetical protein [Methanothermobacter]QHN08195.1 hypothetical protein FZP68_05270 [Methanothermobacter sp. THM-2]WBF09203.1 hypothetical protein ISG34_05055 [Methanothermobacter marburgensis]